AHGHVVPLVRGQSVLRLHADGVVQPALDEVHLELAADNVQAVPLALGCRCHPREHDAALRALRTDPGGQVELGREADPADVAGPDLPAAIEAARLADLAGDEG